MRPGGKAPALGERLCRDERLRLRADYLKCYRQGRRRQGRRAILYFLANQEKLPRLGITASRKVGNAVVRNRLRRRVVEIYRRWPGRGELPPLDLIVHLQPAAARAPFADFRTELLGLLESVTSRR